MTQDVNSKNHSGTLTTELVVHPLLSAMTIRTSHGRGLGMVCLSDVCSGGSATGQAHDRWDAGQGGGPCLVELTFLLGFGNPTL